MWLEENINTIVHGDSCEIIKLIPDKSIDLIITDPPYGKGADKGFHGFGTAKNGSKKYESRWDKETPSKQMFDEILRVGKKVVIFGGNYFSDKLPISKHWDVWDKKGDYPFNNPFSDCELIWTNVCGPCKKYTVVQQGFVNDGDDIIHPTQKPLRLISEIIKKYAKAGDLIGDFYSGSGTVCVAAKEAGYRFIGVEKDEIFYKKSLDRLNGITSTGQTSIFTDFGGV